MRILITIIAIAWGCGTTVFSQVTPPNVRGVVLDEQTKVPVEGASVALITKKQLLATDESGRFLIYGKMEATDSLLITAIGYERTKLSYPEFLQREGTILLRNRIVEMNAVVIALKPGDAYKPVSKVDIKTRDITNSQEVLRFVPGLFIGQHAGGGKAEQIFLRGFDIDHGTDINIAVDGMPVNMVSHAHGQGYADLHFLIPELIDNVSFKKGPYYAEKGNMTTAGYVDFRTKNVLPANSIKLEAGQFNTYRTVGTMNLLSPKRRRQNEHAYVAAEYMYTKGYFDNPQHFNRLNLFGKYHAQLGTANELTVSGSSFSSKWNASGQIPERALQRGLIGFFGAIDPNEGGNTGRTNVNMQLKSTFPDNSFLKNQVYFTHYDFELYSNFTFFLNDDINGDQIRQKEKRNMLGYNGSYSRTNFLGHRKLTSEAGISIRADRTRDTELSRTKDRELLLERVQLGNISELNTGVWINETIQWSERFGISAGLRWDRFDVSYRDKLADNRLEKTNAPVVSPKLNLSYRLAEKAQLYFSTGKGFHSNDTRVVVQAGGRRVLPAAFGADLGIIIKPVPGMLVQAAIWSLSLEQEFVYVGDEGVVEPSGRSRRLGADLSIRYQPWKHLFVDMDANYSHGRSIDEPKGADHLPLAPVVTGVGGVTFKSNKGIHAGIRYRFMGNRPANEDYTVIAKGYFITDAVLSYERKRYEVGISVQNLFDVRWKETQFDTESKLRDELSPVSEIHFTPGSPFFLKAHITFIF